eukprot:g26131.t1
MANEQPRRPSSAYFLWLSENREAIAKSLGTGKGSEVSKKAGQLWRELSQEIRKPFDMQAKLLKADYDKKMTLFKAQGGVDLSIPSEDVHICPRREHNDLAPLRREVLHCYGVDFLSNKEVLEVFAAWEPKEVEWLDDSSCNLVFETEEAVQKAIRELAVAGDGSAMIFSQDEKKGKARRGGPKNFCFQLRVASEADRKDPTHSGHTDSIYYAHVKEQQAMQKQATELRRMKKRQRQMVHRHKEISLSSTVVLTCRNEKTEDMCYHLGIFAFSCRSLRSQLQARPKQLWRAKVSQRMPLGHSRCSARHTEIGGGCSASGFESYAQTSRGRVRSGASSSKKNLCAELAEFVSFVASSQSNVPRPSQLVVVRMVRVVGSGRVLLAVLVAEMACQPKDRVVYHRRLHLPSILREGFECEKRYQIACPALARSFLQGSREERSGGLSSRNQGP